LTEGASIVTRDQAEAQRLGVASTPTFLLGRLRADATIDVRERITGAQSFEVFQRAVQRMIDAPIAKAQSAVLVP
jgi:predicted DsbA family dithiol-disulfide isomerase